VGTIYQSIEILSKEKGIDPQIVIDAVKDAMLVAARKHFRSVEDLIAEFNAQGALEIFAVKTVADPVADPVKEISLHDAKKVDPAAELGSVVRISRPTDALGRISAQTAKQVILQKVREAERETIFSEYSGRVGELVNCIVKRIEGQDLIVDIGKTEARLPKKEQSRLENFSVGDRVRSIIKSVEKAGKNAGVTISRADPDLVKRLFEQEVPEIYDNTVVIKGCAREAGERTKIAVWSRDRDVDCVGACVGMKGMRVQSIIRELRGEKIDIIEYSDDPVQYATKALSPAKISRVAIVDGTAKHMEVIVDDTQLSLAIGKKGQNVRLAAKLLGWKIDIKSEEEKRQEVESAMAALVSPGAPVSVLMDYGLAENIVGQLIAGGVSTIEKLGGMTPEELEELQGIGAQTVERIRDAVNGYYGQFETPTDQLSDDFAVEEVPVDAPAETIAEVEAAAEAIEEAPVPAPDEAEPAMETASPEEAVDTGAGTPPDAPEEPIESDTIGDLGSRPLS
jgi:transcription termination/antitermination protein NusA